MYWQNFWYQLELGPFFNDIFVGRVNRDYPGPGCEALHSRVSWDLTSWLTQGQYPSIDCLRTEGGVRLPMYEHVDCRTIRIKKKRKKNQTHTHKKNYVNSYLLLIYFKFETWNFFCTKTILCKLQRYSKYLKKSIYFIKYFFKIQISTFWLKVFKITIQNTYFQKYSSQNTYNFFSPSISETQYIIYYIINLPMCPWWVL